ncbi:MAG: M14 family zinc carboxypeptidase [Lachnospiraceae bacterium]
MYKLRKTSMAIAVLFSLLFGSVSNVLAVEATTETTTGTVISEGQVETDTDAAASTDDTDKTTDGSTEVGVEENIDNTVDPGEGITEDETNETGDPSDKKETFDFTDFKMEQIRYNRNKVRLSWSCSGKPSYFIIEQSLNGSGYQQIAKVKKQIFNTILEQGSRAAFRVVAYDGNDEEVSKTDKLKMIMPNQAKSFQLTKVTSKTVKLSWSGKATYFKIYRKAYGSSQYTEIGKTAKNTYYDKTVKDNQIYYYRVISCIDNEGVAGSTVSETKRIINKAIVNTSHRNYSYDEMCKDLQHLKEKYSEYLNYESIGTSEDGRQIYDVILGSDSASKTMLVVSTLHAREYICSQLCMKQIESYLERYNYNVNGVKIADTLKKIQIHYVVMSNPDGVTISQQGISAIRDTSLRQRLYSMSSGGTGYWKANARGVDLNNNFPSRFVIRGSAGAEGYTGQKALSESETYAIAKLTKRLKNNRNLKGVINYHAMGQIVFGSCTIPSLSYTTRAMYSLARGLTGYADEGNYYSPSGGAGNYREYVMEDLYIPSITLEVGYGTCPVPIYQFASTWSRNKDLVIREAMLLAGK